MTLLAIDFSSVLVKTGQFILSFSILVILHELGHYLPAKWFTCRVEKFYLFFNPWFSLAKKKIGDTEWGLGWIPFGGYVKISGMIDESMDKEQMKLPPQPYEFRSKKPWQRLIIMLGGVFVNVILAIVIFIGIMWHWGETYVPIENLKYGVSADSLGKKIGVVDGDKIVVVANKKIERVGTVGPEIIMTVAKKITVDRGGKLVDLNIPDGFIEQLNRNKLSGFVYVRFPMIIDSILSKANITNGVLQKGDTLVSINGIATHFSSDIKNVGDIKNKTVTIIVKKPNGDTTSASVFFDAQGNNFIGFKPMEKVLGEHHNSFTFFQAIPAGYNKCKETLSKYILNLKLLFTSKEHKVKDSLGSVLSIADTYAGTWDWLSFWTLTGIFSIILAFMNVLPIPGLDGGHALFTLVEMITGKKPSDKFLEYAQTVGMILLFGLMAYALGLDFWRKIFH
jgi:regulator of sigma E protease